MHCVKKCPYSELFWSAFSRIRTSCRKMRARITPNTETSYAVMVIWTVVALNPLSANPTKWSNSQTIRRQQPVIANAALQ